MWLPRFLESEGSLIDPRYPGPRFRGIRLKAIVSASIFRWHGRVRRPAVRSTAPPCDRTNGKRTRVKEDAMGALRMKTKARRAKTEGRRYIRGGRGVRAAALFAAVAVMGLVAAAPSGAWTDNP